MLKRLFVATQLIFLLQANLASANEEEDINTIQTNYAEQTIADDADDKAHGVVTSIECYSGSGEQTANSLELAAEYYTNNGDYENAIKLCKKALDKDYSDLDIHKAYAIALEDKYKDQDVQDHDLLNQCIKEWLTVYRTEVGWEKGINFHGIDPMGKLFEDEDRGIPAREHLVALTGRAPKFWETDEKYLDWVNRPVASVAGKLISLKPAKTPTPPKNAKSIVENVENIGTAPVPGQAEQNIDGSTPYFDINNK